MRFNLLKALLIASLILIVGCSSDPVENQDVVIEPLPTVEEAELTVEAVEEDVVVEDSEIVAEPTTIPEIVTSAELTTTAEVTTTMRSIEASGPISDPGPLLEEYMSEGLFISHFDSADTEIWYSYSQDTETTIIREDQEIPEGYITSATWHAKQTDKWVQPTDDLNFQSDKFIAGDGAALWADTTLSTRLTAIEIPHDWSEYAFLSFWAHSAVANEAGIQLAIYSELDSTPSDDYYKKEIIIDWEGWRLFEIPLHEFVNTREPVGWDKIDYIKIASSGWGHTPFESTQLIFDEMKLSNVRLGP